MKLERDVLAGIAEKNNKDNGNINDDMNIRDKYKP